MMRQNSPVWTILRFGIFSLLFFVVTLALPVIVGHGDIIVFDEGGPVEWLQFFLITATALLFGVAALFVVRERHTFILLALLAAVAAVREQDSFFDRVIGWGGWEMVAFWIIVAAVLLVCKYWRQVLAQVMDLTTDRGIAIMWAGFVVLVPFAQLVGHGEFLKLVMGDDYDRGYKRVIEEIGELMGYLLILIGSLECVIESSGRQKAALAESADQ